MNKYYPKYPRQGFSNRTENYFRTFEAAKRCIEKSFAAGYTSEPYVQLVRETKEDWTILTEWMPAKNRWVSVSEADKNRWVSALEAEAGDREEPATVSGVYGDYRILWGCVGGMHTTHRTSMVCPSCGKEIPLPNPFD